MGAEKFPQIMVVTYNVLADCYIRLEDYPHPESKAVLSRRDRHSRIAERVRGLAADVVCLQEVEYPVFMFLQSALQRWGCEGHWAHKGADKWDGCATFVRVPFVSSESRILKYRDERGSPSPSGQVALLTLLEYAGRQLMIVNTHLKWDKEGTPPEQQEGYAQGAQLLAYLSKEDVPCIVCGDFNAENDGGLMEAFRLAGFSDAHHFTVMTCNLNGRARKIDYLMHSADLVACPLPAPSLRDKTPLPSEHEPSDHLPLRASFSFASSAR